MDQSESGTAIIERGNAASYERLLAEQESSGLNLRAFARKHGLSPWTLYGWRRKLGRTRRRSGAEASGGGGFGGGGGGGGAPGPSGEGGGGSGGGRRRRRRRRW